jgi:hypothetical protein
MTRLILLALTLLTLAPAASAQTLQTDSVGGMSYYLLPASGGCSAATPCSVVVYASYMDESTDSTQWDLNNYFTGSFAAANPHTIVIAPIFGEGQDSAVNWGGYDTLTTPQSAQVVGIVQSVQASMGNTVNAKDTVITGGSLGGNGTQALLVAYGPKGTVQPGVFSAGLSFDAATYAIAGNSADIAALCGVPLTAVHGTADTDQSVTYDEALQSAIDSNPSCNNSFTFVPVPGAGHGTWAGSSGYSAGVAAGTPEAALTSDLSSGGSSTTATNVAAAPATTATAAGSAAASPKSTGTGATMAATPVAATSAAATTAPSTTTITPGQGSLTDAQGNVWRISADGSVQENDTWVPGGGGTSALTIVNGTVYGQDNGKDGNTANSGGWFTLSSDDKSWTKSAAPAGASTTASAPATTPATANPSATSSAATATSTGPCGSGQNLAAFGTLANQISAPGGQIFLPHGVAVGPDNSGAGPSAVTLKSLFPGINFVRFATWYTSPNMAGQEAYVTSLTQAGIVVEVEDHPFPSPGVYSGQQLQDETAWYTQWASDFKGNPYVWFGTMNEPSGPTNAGIEPQELAIYQAIRGTGSSAMLMLELYGGGNPGTIGIPGGMTQGPYSTMFDVAWDLHFYGWVVNHSTDPATISAAITASVQQAQTITAQGGNPIPVIIGEFGNTTGDAGVDLDGTQVVAAVLSSGLGYAAWTFGGGSGDADNLTSGGALTDYGAQVAAGIASAGGAVATSPVAACSTAMAAVPANAAATPTTPASATTVAQATTTPATDAPPAAQQDPTAATLATANAADTSAQQRLTAADQQIQQAEAANAANQPAQTPAQTAALIAQATAQLQAAQAALVGVSQ